MEFCADNVAQDIESSIQKATVKWNETEDNLKQICEKYKGAVNLWKKYCNESEAIRVVIDQNYSDIDEMINNKSPEEIEVNRANFSSLFCYSHILTHFFVKKNKSLTHYVLTFHHM